MPRRSEDAKQWTKTEQSFNEAAASNAAEIVVSNGVGASDSCGFNEAAASNAAEIRIV